MPEGLTQTKTPNSPEAGRGLIGTVAGFKSEWWPTSNRNGGRIESESALFCMAFVLEGWMIFAITPIFALGGLGIPALQSLICGSAWKKDPASGEIGVE